MLTIGLLAFSAEAEKSRKYAETEGHILSADGGHVTPLVVSPFPASQLESEGSPEDQNLSHIPPIHRNDGKQLPPRDRAINPSHLSIGPASLSKLAGYPLAPSFTALCIFSDFFGDSQ